VAENKVQRLEDVTSRPHQNHLYTATTHTCADMTCSHPPSYKHTPTAQTAKPPAICPLANVGTHKVSETGIIFCSFLISSKPIFDLKTGIQKVNFNSTLYINSHFTCLLTYFCASERSHIFWFCSPFSFTVRKPSSTDKLMDN